MSQENEARSEVFAFETSCGQEIRVALTEYRREIYGDIRRWFEASPGQMKPTRKGICFKAELLPLLEEGVRQLRGKCEEIGIEFTTDAD